VTERLVFNAHLLIALVFGAFITVIAVTGCIVAFEPELDRMMYADISYVRPGIRTLSFREITHAVKRVHADDPIVAFIPSFSW
jgi:uncharacterized iron-regulated membrane protein